MEQPIHATLAEGTICYPQSSLKAVALLQSCHRFQLCVAAFSEAWRFFVFLLSFWFVVSFEGLARNVAGSNLLPLLPPQGLFRTEIAGKFSIYIVNFQPYMG